MEGRQVTIAATRLKLRNHLQIRRFLQIHGEVERQARTAPGLIDYRVRADFLRLRFRTLSVWESDSSLDAFVRVGAHRDAMNTFDEIAVRGESAFVRWMAADALLPTWEEAAGRLAGAVG